MFLKKSEGERNFLRVTKLFCGNCFRVLVESKRSLRDSRPSYSGRNCAVRAARLVRVAWYLSKEGYYIDVSGGKLDRRFNYVPGDHREFAHYLSISKER
jgi:hypothetical protein